MKIWRYEGTIVFQGCWHHYWLGSKMWIRDLNLTFGWNTYLPAPGGKMWRQTSTLLIENKCLFVTSRECQRQCKGLWRSTQGLSTPARTSRGQSHKSGSFFMIKLLFNVFVQSNVTFIVFFRLCSDTFSMISFFDLTSWFGRWVE